VKKLIKLLLSLIILGGIALGWLYSNNLIPKKSYSARDFNIDIIRSSNDADNDGIDDYSDILEGAKKEARNHSKYRSAYYDGGYPPPNEGVCTDVIWRSLQNAGYNLKEMVDVHISDNVKLYSNIKTPDPNIDFRRVKNLKIFFDYNVIVLINDPSRIEEWMPGDIIIFGSNHIAIVSDKRNKDGIPYIIHNAGQPNREEDAMLWWWEKHGIKGHYRIN
jgi:uncharacterized protein YijF (DUF1287 family)